MKQRSGFVSNSSSTVFIVYNMTDETLTVGDFVEEIADEMAKAFVDEYFAMSYPSAQAMSDDMKKQAKEIKDPLKPGANEVEFGDHGGPYGHTIVGEVLDYVLRDGGRSERFAWRFSEWNR